ncbi:MAG TPA: cytochrome c [Rhodocyclaceae bacterium]|nr:cytochrome c [Rhodocyclaceae bacterium]
MIGTGVKCFAVFALALAALPAQAWDAARGKELSTVCGACHGPDGNSPSADFPKLAGQHREYLYRALLDYKLGNRQDPVMTGQVAELSRQDMRDLAAFYATQEGLYLKR